MPRREIRQRKRSLRYSVQGVYHRSKVRSVRSVAELTEVRLVGLGAVMVLHVAFWLVGYLVDRFVAC